MTLPHRKIGSLSVSVVGLGCNNFGQRLDQARTQVVVDAALEAGIDFFDTADAYGTTKSEVFLGQALGARRKQVVVATKFGLALDEKRGGARPEYVKKAAEDSLQRLGTDYIDLYQLHRPDPEVPIADTLGALDELVQAGKVREIGISNVDVAQLEAARGSSESTQRAAFVSVQNEYSLLAREQEEAVLPYAEQRGLGFLPYFPLSSGLLTGKYQAGLPPPEGARLSATDGRLRERFLSERNIGIAEALNAWAKAHGHNLLELAFSWLLLRPAVASVIAGATRPEQVQANVAAIGWKLSEQERADVERIASLRPASERPLRAVKRA